MKNVIFYRLYGFALVSNIPIFGYTLAREGNCANLPQILFTYVEQPFEINTLAELVPLDGNQIYKCFSFSDGKVLVVGHVTMVINKKESSITAYSELPAGNISTLILKSAGIALFMHMAGVLPLHASAVESQNRLFPIAADSGVGKSTLTFSCILNPQARFFSDDIVPLYFEGDRIYSKPMHCGNPKLGAVGQFPFLVSPDFGDVTCYAYDENEFYYNLRENLKCLVNLEFRSLYILKPCDIDTADIQVSNLEKNDKTAQILRYTHALWGLSTIEKAKLINKIRSLSEQINVFEIIYKRDYDTIPELQKVILNYLSM